MFLIFSNDVDDCIIHSKILKFADDIKLFHRFESIDVCTSRFDFLQHDLTRLSNWCSTWLMSLNVSKCACIHFGYNNPGRTYFIGDAAVADCNRFIDLGVLVADNLKPSAQCFRAAARAQKMLAIIKLAFKFLSVHSLSVLYKSFVLPLLEYCSVVWCPYYVRDIEILEKVQRRFTRILPVFRDLPYKDRLEKYHLSSLFARRLYFDLLCVFKIIHGFIDVDANSFFDFGSDPRTRGHDYKIKALRSRLDLRSHWFVSRVIPHWNDLPAFVVRSSTIKGFKINLWKHFNDVGIS